MMTISDTIARLQKLHRRAAGMRRADANALQTAVDILTTLDERKSKAADAIKAMRVCRNITPALDCEDCPYYGDDLKCARQMDADVDMLLTAAYLQGGANDDQT